VQTKLLLYTKYETIVPDSIISRATLPIKTGGSDERGGAKLQNAIDFFFAIIQRNITFDIWNLVVYYRILQNVVFP